MFYKVATVIALVLMFWVAANVNAFVNISTGYGYKINIDWVTPNPIKVRVVE